MIPRARGHAHEREVVRSRDRGDDGLRAVPAGHPDHVRAAGNGILGKRAQIIPGSEQDRLDAPTCTFTLEVEPLDLAAPRLRVHQQHAVPRACRRTPPAGDGGSDLPRQCPRARGTRDRDRRHDDHQVARATSGRHQRHDAAHDREGGERGNPSSPAWAGRADPGHRDADPDRHRARPAPAHGLSTTETSNSTANAR